MNQNRNGQANPKEPVNSKGSADPLGLAADVQPTGRIPAIERISLFGLNHTTAPIEIREQFAVSAEARQRLISRLLSCAVIEEAAVLNTCNRVEFIISLDPRVLSNRPAETERSKIQNLPLGLQVGTPHYHVGVEHSIMMFLEEISGLARDRFRPFIYFYNGIDGAEHLLRVAAGLDSMVPGESEILGQMKAAYDEARQAGATGAVLNPLFQGTFRAAKRVRTKTTVGRQVSSIVSLTRRIARRTFDNLSEKRLLVLGAGDTAELAVKHFHAAGVRAITVLNRTEERAEKIAELFGAECGGLEQITAKIGEVDIVVATALLPAHAGPLVSAAQVAAAAGAAGRCEPLLLLDLGVPRNIAESVRGMPQVALYNIDDLESEVERNVGGQVLELKRAENFIKQELVDIASRLGRTALNSAVEEVRTAIGAHREKQVERALAELRKCGLSESDCKTAVPVLERLFDRAAAEILHNPLSALREAENDEGMLESFRRLFIR